MASKKVEVVEVTKEQVKGCYNRRDHDGELYKVYMVDQGDKVVHLEESKIKMVE